jgi:two-component system response regulator CpxR
MKEGANDSAPGRSTEDSTCDPDFSSAVRILLIDDDRELCTSLQRLLQMNGFDLSFAHNAQDGLTHAVEGQHDLIVLDVMLPGGDGRLLLRKLRTVSEVPVIMLTARGDEKDRIAGLEAGADDYLPKPFNVRELIARIRAILKRHGPRVTLPQPIQLGDLEIFPTQRRVVQSSSEIAEVCLGRPVGMFDRSVDNHISNLRKKLGATFQGKDRIQNLRGTGYVYTGGPAS